MARVVAKFIQERHTYRVVEMRYNTGGKNVITEVLDGTDAMGNERWTIVPQESACTRGMAAELARLAPMEDDGK